MRNSSPYTLVKRPKMPYYYVQYKDSSGKYKRLSTGETTEAKAHIAAARMLVEGTITSKDVVPTLRAFSRGFFMPSGEWATLKRIDGKRLSDRHCREREDLLNNHLLPSLGDMVLNEIDKESIRGLKLKMANAGYSGTTINHVLSVLSAILDQAETKGIIKATPKIERASSKVVHERGILTPEEMSTLLTSANWTSLRAKVACMLAASTGLRAGELQALTRQDIHLDAGYIEVSRSWDERLHKLNETTKTGRSRRLILTDSVKLDLARLLAESPYTHDGAFVFWSERIDMPVSQMFITRGFESALDSIGINKDERKRRNLVFHGFRHYLNSILINAKIPLQKVQAITGHLSDKMSERYYHVDDMTDVKGVIDDIF